MRLYDYIRGEAPLLVSIPHCGSTLPEPVAEGLTPAARALPDTDWHVDRLYDFAAGLGASVLAARLSRYVVDLNRPPDDQPLYPGAKGTGLCPTTTFDGAPLYREGAAPDAGEIAGRLDAYWWPYHEKIAAELARIKARHGLALLFDAHSIRSRVPRLFDGRLTDLNLGTAGGESAAHDLTARLVAVCDDAKPFTNVLNGRFTGGYITRAYGRPAERVHAVQLELAQLTYMVEDPPYSYLPERAETVRPVLEALLGTMIDWALAGGG